MPRGRTKSDIEYFPHLLKDSTTIRALEMLYGNDGYAVWFKLLELLGSNAKNDYRYKAKTKEECNKILEKCRVDAKLFAKILDTLCELNAIDKVKWKNERILYVPNLVNNVQKMRKKINANTNLIEKEETTIKKDKKQYLEYVFLTETEFEKLVDKFGIESTNERIESLNDWIGQNPTEKKRQKSSHYYTILNWDRMEQKKNKQNNTQVKQPQYKDLSNHTID